MVHLGVKLEGELHPWFVLGGKWGKKGLCCAFWGETECKVHPGFILGGKWGEKGVFRSVFGVKWGDLGCEMEEEGVLCPCGG